MNKKTNSSDKSSNEKSAPETQKLSTQIKQAYQWGVIKYIDKEGVLYRLVSAPHDGEDAVWSLNSGIRSFEIQDGYVDFHGFSGSIYRCKFQDQGFSQQMLITILGWRATELELGNDLDLMPFALFLREWEAKTPRVM
ncbi:MAG: hypothetical protein A0129_15330 [Limnobacter sp. CACIAM 66H1]|uniref:hypothetical protein n=1 Tax=Limnobacter sp. CACIAM 66H1 TaxID=1813033 RepID=UPI0007A89999|nr:hypothetical protein [Limnobacter sp. CACIAM 66H1]KYP10002.1 MAG: hypothetical protein A0129_15330 [Limnobacter sp. CACIAM 66H1]